MKQIRIPLVLWLSLLCLWIPKDADAQRDGKVGAAEAASIDSCPTNLSYILTSPGSTKNPGTSATFHYKLNTGTRKVSRIDVAMIYPGAKLDYDVYITSGYPKPWGSNNWSIYHDAQKQVVTAVLICDTATAINDSLFGIRFDVGCIPYQTPASVSFVGDCSNDSNRVHVPSVSMDFGPGTRTPGSVSNEVQTGSADLVPDTASTGKPFTVPLKYATNVSADSGFDVKIVFRDDKITYDSLQQTGTDTQGKTVSKYVDHVAGADTLEISCDQAIHSGGVMHTLFNLWFTNNMADNYDTTLVKSTAFKLYNCAGINDFTLNADDATLLTRFMAIVSAESVSTPKTEYGNSDIRVLNNFSIHMQTDDVNKRAVVSVDTATWVSKIAFNQILQNTNEGFYWERTHDSTSQYHFKESTGNNSEHIPVSSTGRLMFELKYLAGSSTGTAQMDLYAQQTSSHPDYRKDCRFTAANDTSVVIYGAGTPTDISLTDGTITITGGGGGGGSCPFVYTWNGTEYRLQDVILTGSEGQPEGQSVTDFLPLADKPILDKGMYRIRIHEQEAEKTFLDHAELLVVDHEPGSQLSVDLKGNLIFGGEKLRPIAAVDDQSNDIVHLLSALDGAAFERSGAGSLCATFEGGRGNHYAITADDSTGMEGGDFKNPCKVWTGPEGLAGLKPAAVKLEIEDANGEWQQVPRGPMRLPGAHVRPVVNLSEYDLGETFRIRYSWEGSFEIDELALVVQTPAEYTVTTVQASSVTQSGDHPTAQLIKRADDRYAELVTGEFIDLEFPAAPLRQGMERSFVLAANGYYLTWYGHENAGRPLEFGLNGNYPNPFNPSTTIRYSLAVDATVTLEVFNILGQKVRTLVSGASQTVGAYEAFWDGTNEKGEPVGSGAYLYRLTADDLQDTRKMIMLK